MLPLNQIGPNSFRGIDQYWHLFPSSTDNKKESVPLNTKNCFTINTTKEEFPVQNLKKGYCCDNDCKGSNELEICNCKCHQDYIEPNTFSNLKSIEKPLKSILRKPENQPSQNRQVSFGSSVVRSYSASNIYDSIRNVGGTDVNKSEGDSEVETNLEDRKENNFQMSKTYYPSMQFNNNNSNNSYQHHEEQNFNPNSMNNCTSQPFCQNGPNYLHRSSPGCTNFQNVCNTQQCTPVSILKSPDHNNNNNHTNNNNFYSPDVKMSETNVPYNQNVDFLKYCRNLQNSQMNSASQGPNCQNFQNSCDNKNFEVRFCRPPSPYQNNPVSNYNPNMFPQFNQQFPTNQNQPPTFPINREQTQQPPNQFFQTPPSRPASPNFQHFPDMNSPQNCLSHPTNFLPPAPPVNRTLTFNPEVITNIYPANPQVVHPINLETSAPLPSTHRTSVLSAFGTPFSEEMNEGYDKFQTDNPLFRTEREDIVLPSSCYPNPVTISRCLNLPPHLNFLKTQNDVAFFYQDRFELLSDVRAFTPEKIRVNVLPLSIEIQTVIDYPNGNNQSTGFCRKYELPYRTIPEQACCFLHHDGILVIAVPWNK